jgi:hypothetical protein
MSMTLEQDMNNIKTHPTINTMIADMHGDIEG